MSMPIGGLPFSFFSSDSPTVVIINVPSSEIFDIMRGMIHVIHSANVQQDSFRQQGKPRDHSFKPMASPSPTPQTAEVDSGDSNPGATLPASASPGDMGKKNDPGAKPSHVDGLTGDPQDKTKSEISTKIKVPDLTDHSLPRDDKEKYQRLLRDMLDRISRLVKDMSLARDATGKNDLEGLEVAEQARKSMLKGQLATGGERDPQTKGVIEDKTDSGEIADSSRQIGLIIENTDDTGKVKRISVEKGDIAELLQNLEGLLGQGLGEDVQDAISGIVKQDATAPEKGKANLKTKGGKSPRIATPSQQPSPLKAGEKADPLTAPKGISPTVIAAAASYMPFPGQKAERLENIAGDEAYRIQGVEKIEETHSLGQENKGANESGKSPVREAAMVAKASRKGALSKEVQEVVSAASKEQGAKKTTVGQRVDDHRIVPVAGKFTVEQLIAIRKKGGKTRPAAAGGHVESHRLIDVLYMILCAVVCGSQTVFDIAAYIESREKWFAPLLGLKGGVPSARLLSRFIGSLNPKQLTEMLSVWMREAQGAPSRTGLSSINMTETFEGLVFSQERGGGASTAELCMPRILQFFDVKGFVILLSNGRISKKMIDPIVHSGAHYIYDCGEEAFPHEEEYLPLFAKAIGNPKSAPEVERTESYVEGQEFLQLFEIKTADGAGHEQSVSQVLTEVRTAKGKEDNIQFFVSSLPKQSVWLFDLLRTQRHLEGKALWTMNMSMRGRSADDAALSTREFIALIRRYAGSILLRDQSFKAPIHVKQQRATKESDYLVKLLKLSFSY